MSEGFTTHGEFGGKKSDESKHCHTPIQLFGTIMESPALFCFDDFHAGFRSEGIQSSTIFSGDGGAADHGGGRRLGHDTGTGGIQRIVNQD